MKILLNGLGRIGKAILRISLNNKDIEIVAINEINSNIKNIAYILSYDSTYGRLDDPFKSYGTYISNNKNKIKIYNKKSLFDINFSDLSIDCVIDASGQNVDVERLRQLKIKFLFLTHPNKAADINVVLGVNDDKLNFKKHKIISTSSCNAVALSPVLKIIDEQYSIKYGDITTVHPLLSHQKVLDNGCVGSFDRKVECNFEFGRSSLENIIPSKTTTINACSYVIPKITNDFISSNSLRVPTNTVGVINLTLTVNKSCTTKNIINLFENYSKKQKFDIVLNNYKELVSSDFKSESYTSIIDHRFTDVIKNKMIKMVIWYDNEWGYASKVLKFTSLFIKNSKRH